MITLMQNSIANLKAHKLKVGLTIFLITIGITAVMIIGSIGNGVKNQMLNSTQNISNQKTVISFYPNDDSMYEFLEFMSPITQSDITKIQSLKGVQKVKILGAEDMYSSGEIKFSDLSAYIDVYGFSENGDDENKDNYSIVYGRNINESDRNKNVIILNENSLMDMNIDTQKLIGKGIEFNGIIYEVIGIMSAPDNIGEGMSYEWNPLSYSSLIPKSTLDSISSISMGSSTSYTSLEVEALKGYDVRDVESRIIDLLSTSHPGIEGYYSTEGAYDMSAEIDTMISTVNKFIFIATAVAMFIGGLSVMNIMYVSVIERKKEIGIRRSIGATPTNIIAQFLAESTFVTLIGGFMGLIVGSIVLNLVSPYVPFTVELSVSIYTQAFISCVATGVLSGLIPAIKASKIDPIEAIQL